MRHLKHHLQHRLRSPAGHRHQTGRRTAIDLREESGQVSVLTALLLVVLLGMAALVVDVGLLYYERAQLKNGADSAALAIAQNCAADQCPQDASSLATALAGQNAGDHVADASVDLDSAAGRVTVETVTRTEDGGHALALALAPVLGIDSATVTSRSSAGWFSPVSGRNVLPLTVSWCQFNGMLDGGVQLVRTNPNENAGCSSTSIPGDTSQQRSIPGGFGWLKQPAGKDCATEISLTDVGNDDVLVDPLITSDPGNDVPQNCRNVLPELLNKPVLLPVYSEVGGQGANGWYRIIGFAAFELHGWKFSGSEHNNTSPSSVACTGNCRGIIGEFVTFVSLDAGEQDYVFGPGGKDFGVRLVTLIE
ncbi:pilus assembly protein TadG-related protein [Citricoccus sp. GCM10030269]|uniref:pilus assembly protein TadG-related protein n=1 Tax=Citricoccus sp. GCM10030269 TaxID=3273388 RepID=UPI00361E9879